MFQSRLQAKQGADVDKRHRYKGMATFILEYMFLYTQTYSGVELSE